MKNAFRGQILKGQIHFGSIHNQARFIDWAKENDKKRVILTIDEPTSTQLRRFFEGAIVPYYSYQQFVFDKEKGHYRRFSLLEARESLKLEFNPVYLLHRTGEKHIIAGTTTILNKGQFRMFLDKIQRWFMENGYDFPDSKDYKKWQDSSPLIGEVYPPLQKIIELSDIKLKELQNA